MVVIRYHAWWAGYDPYYNFNTSENAARINYYGADYTPHFWIDGHVNGGSNTSGWNGLIANELREESPLEIDISGSYDPVSRDGDLHITVTATDAIDHSNLKLRIAVTESRLYWHAPNGGDWHHQTFRDMLPNTSGISFSIEEGQSEMFDQSFSLHPALVDENCEIAVFVQSDNGHWILQGAKTGVMSLNQPGELAPFSLISPEDGGTVNTCYPTLVWHSTYEPGWDEDVYYTAEISVDESFSDPISSGPQMDTTYVSEVCLVDGIAYYWRVMASNGHAPDIYSDEVFSFTVVESGDCVYAPGDCNHNGVPLELGDVVNMISMYRGSAEPSYVCDCGVDPPGPEFAATADPSGNCVAMELGDVVTEIGAYRGSATASGCVDCPGSDRLLRDGRRDYPLRNTGR
jgi:hypothetical protein